MSRSVPWRRACPDALSRRMDETFQTVMYIVHQAGPTGFVLKHEDKKFKVFLGDPHSCTCPIFKKEKDLCVHILWLLLKKFRIPKKNQIVYQFGLIEREIHEVINGYLTQQSPRQEEATVPSLFQQRPVSQDDVCPICQDELMSEKPQRLTHCKHGCGQNVHLKCVKVWAEHQKSQGEKNITCPLCRETFSSFEELKNELQFKRLKQNNLARKTLHFDTYCSQCEVCPISGRCYKCAVCVDMYLCHSCFVDNHHAHHSFHFRQDSTHPWRPAPRCTSLPSPLPQSFIDDIQTRELHENDYEALLRLDTNATTTTHQHDPLITPSIPQYILYSFKSEPLNHNHPLILLGSACFICNETFIRGDWIRKLPCKHKFHRECIDDWLTSRGHTSCPVDGKTVYEKKHREGHKLKNIHTTNGVFRNTDNINITIEGHGFKQSEANSSSSASLLPFSTMKADISSFRPAHSSSMSLHPPTNPLTISSITSFKPSHYPHDKRYAINPNNTYHYNTTRPKGVLIKSSKLPKISTGPKRDNMSSLLQVTPVKGSLPLIDAHKQFKSPVQ